MLLKQYTVLIFSVISLPFIIFILFKMPIIFCILALFLWVVDYNSYLLSHSRLYSRVKKRVVKISSKKKLNKE